MRNLRALLERFSKNLNRTSLFKEHIINTVEKLTRARLSPEQINLREGILEINAGGAVKSEICLKEDQIKSELRSLGVYVGRILYK